MPHLWRNATLSISSCESSLNKSPKITQKRHRSHQDSSRPRKMQVNARVICQGHRSRTEKGVNNAHDTIVDFFGVLVTGFEFECAVVTGHDTGETIEHFAEGRVDVEVEVTFDVVGCKFTVFVEVLFRLFTVNGFIESGLSVWTLLILTRSELRPYWYNRFMSNLFTSNHGEITAADLPYYIIRPFDFVQPGP